MQVSVNGAPVRLSASHGRIDQLDQTLSPMRISIALSFDEGNVHSIAQRPWLCGAARLQSQKNRGTRREGHL
jgi:hypothetical protein